MYRLCCLFFQWKIRDKTYSCSIHLLKHTPHTYTVLQERTSNACICNTATNQCFNCLESFFTFLFLSLVCLENFFVFFLVNVSANPSTTWLQTESWELLKQSCLCLNTEDRDRIISSTDCRADSVNTSRQQYCTSNYRIIPPSLPLNPSFPPKFPNHSCASTWKKELHRLQQSPDTFNESVQVCVNACVIIYTSVRVCVCTCT